jgi:hypothetical protein
MTEPKNVGSDQDSGSDFFDVLFRPPWTLTGPKWDIPVKRGNEWTTNGAEQEKNWWAAVAVLAVILGPFVYVAIVRYF